MLLLPILVIAAGAAGYTAPAPAAGPNPKVEQKVVDQVNANGKATFWVILKEKADLSKVSKIGNWNERGTLVVDELKTTAEKSQAGLRGFLKKAGAQYQPFWIINAIKVTAGQGVLNNLASDPAVEQILADRTYEVPKPISGSDEPKVNTVEWNINDIGAPNVWSTYTDRGEGIVVANIDTGVQWNHPAVINQYRGHHADGSVDHNYNWFDPSNVCGSPSTAPCDNVDHGTHTMGTMVGDDGDPGANQIGVAPHAKWIAAKGCESSSCSLDALMASGQWVMAPTDLNGNNPRPDLRANIVNNSWGDGPSDPFYQGTVQAWVADGIFPAFANGNAGPSCGTVGVPGAYPESYGVGAFDINHNIAFFSSRGPSSFGSIIKPNVSAPGVNVRSSIPNNSYANFSGTSMATPHLAATVALIWSAAPAIIGDIDATRAILDSTAIDTNDLSCGGTAGNNNVWGEGRLDAFAAVTAAPRGPTGTLQGTVSGAGGGGPISGATVHAAGPSDRTVVTDAAGHYSMLLPIGSYNVTASAFGYVTQTANNVPVNDGQTTTRDFTLAQAPHHSVAGHVRDTGGAPVANATVEILNTPIPPATTDASGAYSFASVPDGEYDVRATGGRCYSPDTRHLSLNGNVSNFDFTIAQRHDNFGYECTLVDAPYVAGDTALPLSGDDNFTSVGLPFTFTYYGNSYSTANVATNGYINFLSGSSFFGNSEIPSSFDPNGAIYPFWDDLYVYGDSSMWTKSEGSAPDRKFTIEWRNVGYFGDSGNRVNFEATLTENGRILIQYQNVDGSFSRNQGDSATIGIENATGDDALQYSFNEASLAAGHTAILFKLPPSGFIEGHVKDANDNLAISGATVKVMQGGSTVRQLSTDANGFYRTQVPVGTYDVQASAPNYETQTKPAAVAEDRTTTVDFTLKTPRAEVTPNSLEVIVPAGQTRTRTLVLKNTGSLAMDWQIRETGGGAAGASAIPAKNPGFDANAMNTRGLYVNGTPAGAAPQSPGQVIRSWPTAPLSLAWGVGYTGNVWLSDVPSNNNNHEFTPLGSPTGRMWHAAWAGAWPGDMALDTNHGSMCQVNVGGDNGIYCWNPNTGTVTGSITGSFPWTATSQRGLGYNSNDDTFYIGGWNEGVLYKVKGLGYPDKGAVVSQCNPPDPNISGLAWNPAFNIVWEATNSPSDTIYELNPDTCQVITTLAHPNPGFNGAGMEMDEAGNLWMLSQNAHQAYLVDSGVPAFQDVPWMSENPDHGSLAPGASQNVVVTINTTGLSPGVYNATLFFQTNSGRNPSVRVPVRLIVPAYQQGVEAGGTGAFVDGNQDTWAKDKAYSAGSWGYTVRGNEASTKTAIGGTLDDPLYQTARRGQTEYKFDGLPTGVYQVELRFAEIQNYGPNKRLFDVTVEGNIVLFGFDIAGEVGKNYADDKSYFVPVTDGQLNVRFLTRQADKEPLVNGIRVTHRPDR